MHENEFTDEAYIFGNDVPVDSVNQMFYYWVGEWYCARQEYNKALEYGKKALPYYHGASLDKTDCLNLLGVVNVRLGDFASGFSYTKQCVDIDMQSGDNERIALSLSTLRQIEPVWHIHDSTN